MNISARIEQPIGATITRRQFTSGESIRITGTVHSWIGTPFPNVAVKMTMYTSSQTLLSDTFVTNIWGNYWFDITIPSYEGTAIIALDAESAHAKIYIGIGVPADKPQDEANASLWKWGLLLLGGVAVGYVVVKAARKYRLQKPVSISTRRPIARRAPALPAEGITGNPRKKKSKSKRRK